MKTSKPTAAVRLHADVQRRLPRIVVEDHPYDIGYWARRAGLEQPKDAVGARGWDQCAVEMTDEPVPPLNEIIKSQTK